MHPPGPVSRFFQCGQQASAPEIIQLCPAVTLIQPQLSADKGSLRQGANCTLQASVPNRELTALLLLPGLLLGRGFGFGSFGFCFCWHRFFLVLPGAFCYWTCSRKFSFGEAGDSSSATQPWCSRTSNMVRSTSFHVSCLSITWLGNMQPSQQI